MTVWPKDFKVRRFVPDALALVGPPESYCWFSFASAFQFFLAVGSPSLFRLCICLIFYVLGDVFACLSWCLFYFG